MDRQRCWSAWQDRAASQVLRCEWLNNRIRSGVLQISVRPILLTGAIVETPVDIGTLIERTPGIRGGRPCIAGTGVSVMRIVGWYNLGLTPEEIAADYPHLSLAQVHAARPPEPTRGRLVAWIGLPHQQGDAERRAEAEQ